jgi:hypothetical protein
MPYRKKQPEYLLLQAIVQWYTWLVLVLNSRATGSYEFFHIVQNIRCLPVFSQHHVIAFSISLSIFFSSNYAGELRVISLR